MNDPRCPWTDREVGEVRALYGRETIAEISRRLGRSPESVRGILRRLRIRLDRGAWLDRHRVDSGLLRSLAVVLEGGATVREAAVRFGRSSDSVKHLCARHHLRARICFKTPPPSPRVVEAIRRMNADGWPDTRIAASLGISLHHARRDRRLLGLPSRGDGPRMLAENRYKTAMLCRSHGVASFRDLKPAMHRRRVEAAGWPGVPGPRHAGVLQVLADRGPMTRRQIAEVVGVPAWKRPSVNVGYYLSSLIALGLVLNLGPVAREGRHPVALYALSLTAERVPHADESSEPFA